MVVIRILVVDDAPNTLGNIDRLLTDAADMETCGNAYDGEAALPLVRGLRPDVVLMDMDLPDNTGLETTTIIAREFPSIAIIATIVDDSPEALGAITAAGARAYLLKPFSGAELLDTIRQVYTPSADNVPTALGDEALPPSSGPRIVALVAGKGGVGTSTLAANTALLLSNEWKQRVALIDCDFLHGDLARLLRVELHSGFWEKFLSTGLDEQQLMDAFVRGPAGVWLLGPAFQSSIPPDVDADFATRLCTMLRTLFDVVILDIPSHLSPATRAALSAADQIVVVSSMSDLGVRATQKLLAVLATQKVPNDRLRIMLNRNEANSDLSKSVVEEAIGHPSSLQLPYDPILVSTSVNHGAPFVLQKPEAQVSRRIRELAALLMGAPMTPLGLTQRQGPAPREVEAAPTQPIEKKKRGLFRFAKP